MTVAADQEPQLPPMAATVNASITTTFSAGLGGPPVGLALLPPPTTTRPPLNLTPGSMSVVPGTATLTRPPDAAGDSIAIAAVGSGRIRGIRIVSTATAPIAVAIQLAGGDRRIALVDIDGPMRAGIEIASAASVHVSGCFVHTAHGPAVVIDAAGDVAILNNTFVRAGAAAQPALVLRGGARPVVERNLFGGYGAEIIAGAPPDASAQLLSGTFLAASAPTGVQ